jgi:hypothetical protein
LLRWVGLRGRITHFTISRTECSKVIKLHLSAALRGIVSDRGCETI